MAHNPGSGEAVFVAATRQTYFRPSTSLPLKSFGD
jgi:nucleoid DNA-binding protein